MIRTPKLLAILASLAILPALVAGCGGDADVGTVTVAPQDVSLVLDWFPNADHSGIYVAMAAGLDMTAGADITASVPSDPTTTLTQVAAGRADLAITYAPELLIARQKGIPVKAVGAIAQVPLNAIIARTDRGITRPRDLEGKVVGITGVPSDRALLDTVVTADGGDPTKVTTKIVGYSLSPMLAAGTVDAVIGAYWNIEVPDLRRKGVPVTVLKLDDYGVPRYNELVLVASEDIIVRRGTALRAALAGIAQGQRTAVADPGAARSALVAANPDIATGPLADQIAATLSALIPDGSTPLHMDSGQWDALADWMRANRLLTGQSAGSDAIDTTLLPEESR
ncbi:MAG: hypothetical protein EXQ74_03895 [Thermoleophilia bacterium]|nr:hypothetical protein [Thermoleophilia bacterium]